MFLPAEAMLSLKALGSYNLTEWAKMSATLSLTGGHLQDLPPRLNWPLNSLAKQRAAVCQDAGLRHLL